MMTDLWFPGISSCDPQNPGATLLTLISSNGCPTVPGAFPAGLSSITTSSDVVETSRSSSYLPSSYPSSYRLSAAYSELRLGVGWDAVRVSCVAFQHCFFCTQDHLSWKAEVSHEAVEISLISPSSDHELYGKTMPLRPRLRWSLQSPPPTHSAQLHSSYLTR